MEYSLRDAFKYPFKNFKPFWNWLWVFLPIIGWFYLAGYALQILGSVVSGKDKGLPSSIGFGKNFVEGLKVFVFLIPLYLVLGLIGWLAPEWVYVICSIAVSVPYIFLYPKYALSRKFGDLYDYGLGWAMVFKNFKDFLLYIIFYIVLFLVWGIGSIFIITVCITFPALEYGVIFLEGKLYAKATKKKTAKVFVKKKAKVVKKKRKR